MTFNNYSSSYRDSDWR